MVYVDDADVRKCGCAWFHLLADDIQEMHAFAAKIGVSPRAFHRGARHPHYDVTALQRRRAMLHGAVAITTRDAVVIGRRISLPSRDSLVDVPQLALFI